MARTCSEVVVMRVTPEEKALLFKKAAQLGMSVTGFLLWESLGEELGQAIIDARDRKKRTEHQ